jgi:cytochrome b561
LKYDKATRWLHAGLALGITLQLALSLVMEHSEPDKPATGIAAATFEVHENVGMVVLAILVLHWLWQLTGHTLHGLGHLFPWFSANGRAAVMADAKRLVASRMRDNPQVSPLAGAVHGLGILVATAMGVSGAVLYFGMADNGSMSKPVHVIEEFHGLMANLMWAYLVGHVAMGALHRKLGHAEVSDIFRLK